MTELLAIFSERVSWGFDNPNKTGAFFCLLMLACWLPVFFRASFFPWVLALNGFLGAVVVMTQSRGAVVAALAGLVVIAWFGRKLWSKRMLGASLVLAALLVLLTLYQGTLAKRFLRSAEDRSVLNRLALWDGALHMIDDAPGGWGRGRAADAFHQWYQKPGVQLDYKNLVNSHLTWMAEWNTATRWAYLVGWGAIMVLCFPSSQRIWYAVALACWVAFGLAAAFSSVAHEAPMWIVPSLFFLGVVVDRCVSRVWPRPRFWFLCLVPALLFFSLEAAYVRSFPHSPQVRLDQSMVHVGIGPLSAFVLDPDKEILGSRYGHTLRRWMEKHPGHSVQVEWKSPSRKFPEKGVFLLSGDFDPERLQTLARASERHFVWFNPELESSDEARLPHESEASFLVVRGSLRSRPDKELWMEWTQKSAGVQFREAPGVGDFFSAWPEEIPFPDAGSSGAKAQ